MSETEVREVAMPALRTLRMVLMLNGLASCGRAESLLPVSSALSVSWEDSDHPEGDGESPSFLVPALPHPR